MVPCRNTFVKLGAPFIRHSVRAYSTPIQEKDIKKSVYISQSKDIYTNLALEDWLYQNFDFKNHHILLLWQNNPCVVIGRHQNPWLEANISDLDNITQNGVKLARRNSGGGTVFHDLGNLNLTFFTDRKNYNRRYNLEIITRAVFREYNLKIDISSREDLTLRNYKVSGTAAKLGRNTAYHHCTLLVNANKANLSQSLQKADLNIETNATKSIRSKIMNLCEEDSNIDVETLCNAISLEYLRTPALTIKDGGIERANEQKGIQFVNPSEEWFPGIENIRKGFESWEWRFGKTPKFSFSQSFTVPEIFTGNKISKDVKVTMVVENGKIRDVNFDVSLTLVSCGVSVNAFSNLIGHQYSERLLDYLEWSVGAVINDKDKLAAMSAK